MIFVCGTFPLNPSDGVIIMWLSILITWNLFGQVGRIIGKGGQNVRELQRVTGSIIKLPEHGTAPAEEETTVHIIGPFFSVQVNMLILVAFKMRKISNHTLFAWQFIVGTASYSCYDFVN